MQPVVGVNDETIMELMKRIVDGEEDGHLSVAVDSFPYLRTLANVWDVFRQDHAIELRAVFGIGPEHEVESSTLVVVRQCVFSIDHN